MKESLFILPSVDRYKSRKEWEVACWKKIVKSPKHFARLITPFERHQLVLRAAAFDCVRTGKKSSQIARELWLSPQTISSIKKAVYKNGYISYRERGKSERRKRTYSNTLTQKKRRPSGRPVRMKYGIVYLP